MTNYNDIDLNDFNIASEGRDDQGTIEIYNQDDVGRKLAEDLGDEPLWDSDVTLSNEETAWRKRLKALVREPSSARRRLLIADQDTVARVEALKETSPHFAPVIELFARAAKLSMATHAALSVPPLLLLGSAGIGKTHLAAALSIALQTRVEKVQMDTLADRGELTGLSLSWKAARPGRIATALLQSETCAPVFLLDEVDKVSAIHVHEQPLAFLHSVLEPQNARRYCDEYLTIPMRADYCVWILTANSVEPLAPSIRDRLMIFEIGDPSHEDLLRIAEGVYKNINARFNDHFGTKPSDDVLARLARSNPRHMRKLAEQAFGYACHEGRRHVHARDVEQALKFLDEIQGRKHEIGFL